MIDFWAKSSTARRFPQAPRGTLDLCDWAGGGGLGAWRVTPRPPASARVRGLLAGAGVRYMGLSVHGGDVLCHEGGYYKVELACRTDGQYALLTLPLVIARREGHACVLRPAASRF